MKVQSLLVCVLNCTKGQSLFVCAVLFHCCNCKCLNKFFLLDNQSADFKGHKELVYNQNKDDNKVDKVDW